jgi:hypothetical protein
VRRQQSARSCQPASVRGHSAVVLSRTFATGVLPWQVVTPSRRQRWLAAAIKMAIASSAPVSQSRITGKPAAAGPASAAAAAVVRWLAMIAARLADTALLATRCIAPSGHSSRPPAARCCGRTLQPLAGAALTKRFPSLLIFKMIFPLFAPSSAGSHFFLRGGRPIDDGRTCTRLLVVRPWASARRASRTLLAPAADSLRNLPGVRGCLRNAAVASDLLRLQHRRRWRQRHSLPGWPRTDFQIIIQRPAAASHTPPPD